MLNFLLEASFFAGFWHSFSWSWGFCNRNIYRIVEELSQFQGTSPAFLRLQKVVSVFLQKTPKALFSTSTQKQKTGILPQLGKIPVGIDK